jgi:Icc protein
MPVSLAPVTRRRFLAGSLAAGAGQLLRGPLFGAKTSPVAPAGATDPNRVALLADTHVAADKAMIARGSNMFDNLTRVCGEVLAKVPATGNGDGKVLDKLPAAVILNGDFAYLKGAVGEYASAVEGVKPLREAGLPVHVTLGNHDHRDNLIAAVRTGSENEKPPVVGRHVRVLEMPLVNWFLLDSLDVVNATPGELGAAQLAWLARGLDARAKKPAIVMVHHNPDDKPKPSGLRDTKALLDMIVGRRQVKALMFGHTHNWEVTRRDGLHFINLPPVGYVFKATNPSGWVDAHLAEDGITLDLRCIDPKHPKHGERHELQWRD